MFKVSMGRASALKVVVAGVVLLALFAAAASSATVGKRNNT